MTQRAPNSFEHLWQQLGELSEDVIGEIVGGEIRANPRPNPPHLRAASALGVLVGGPFGFGTGGGGPGGWVILAEPRIRFGDDVRVPDLAGSSYARAGVAHLWLLDPLAKTLEVLRLQGELWVVTAVHTGDAQVRAEPFDAIELDLGMVWRGRG